MVNPHFHQGMLKLGDPWFEGKGNDTEKRKGNDQLDTFFDQVEEFVAFFYWDECETCCQARTHLRGTAWAYIKRVPFQPCSWDQLRERLLKCFQPLGLTGTYNAQFRSRRWW